MIGAGTYVLTTALLAAVILAVAVSARPHPSPPASRVGGAPSHLVDAILAVALLIWLSELLGVMQILYDWTLVAASCLLAVGVYAWTHADRDQSDGEPGPAGGVGEGASPAASSREEEVPSPTTRPPAGTSCP